MQFPHVHVAIPDEHAILIGDARHVFPTQRLGHEIDAAPEVHLAEGGDPTHGDAGGILQAGGAGQ